MNARVCGNQRRTPHPLGLEVQAVVSSMWVPGTKLASSTERHAPLAAESGTPLTLLPLLFESRAHISALKMDPGPSICTPECGHVGEAASLFSPPLASSVGILEALGCWLSSACWSLWSRDFCYQNHYPVLTPSSSAPVTHMDSSPKP